MSEPKKWTWDAEKREVVIHENGDYMLGISETQYVTVRVEVGNGKNDQSERSEPNKEV